MGMFDFFKSKQVQAETFSAPREQYQAFHGINKRNANDSSRGLNYQRELVSGKYVMFGDDNLYPNYLNDLFNSSGLHAAI